MGGRYVDANKSQVDTWMVSMGATYGPGYVECIFAHANPVEHESPTPKRVLNGRARRAGLRQAIASVLERDEQSCVLCGEPMWHVHHIVPISQGGDNSLDNLVCLCGPCHAEIHANPLGGLACSSTHRTRLA
jgi:hypothetical protein